MDDIKEKKDIFQKDSIPKVILAMAIPTIISQMITVLYNYADTIFIGQLNDPLQSAAIALTLPLTFLITAIANCWGIGGGSMIATLFIRDADTVRYATQFIRRLCLSVPLYAITLTVNSFFQAANKPKHSLAISVMRKGIFDLPLMVLFNMLFAVTSIIWVQPIMDSITAVISLFVLKRFFKEQGVKQIGNHHLK